MTAVTEPVSPVATRGRAIAAFARAARERATKVRAQLARVTRSHGATALGASGLGSIATGAGAQWGWPVGLMVGGALAVWFASLLGPGE